MKKTFQEQLTDLSATREAKTLRMQQIMEKSSEESRSLDDAEREEFDTLRSEIKSIGEDMARVEEMVDIMKSTARPAAEQLPVGTPAGAVPAQRIHVTSNLPKGTRFTRYCMALARAKGDLMLAHEIAKSAWADTPEVASIIKTATAAGSTTDTTWAAPLVQYQDMANEFIELLRPQTIVGRIPSIRRVPFNVRLPRQTGGGVYQWVGEGKAKPVGSLAFDTVTLQWAKVAGIIVLTDELVRMSNPSAEALVRDDMLNGIAKYIDQQFIDPTVAAVSNVSPASVTNGVTPVHATGTTADDFRADAASMWSDTFLGQNLAPTSGVWVMSNTTAMYLSLMMNTLGQPEFPTITPTGGTLLGYPVVTSESLEADSNGGFIAFLNASDILLSEDSLMIDASKDASLQMDTAPDEPGSASTVLVSLWQRNLIGLRAERYINWSKRRANAVGLIDRTAYGT